MTDNGKHGVGVVGIGWVSHQHIMNPRARRIHWT